MVYIDGKTFNFANTTQYSLQCILQWRGFLDFQLLPGLSELAPLASIPFPNWQLVYGNYLEALVYHDCNINLESYETVVVVVVVVAVNFFDLNE